MRVSTPCILAVFALACTHPYLQAQSLLSAEDSEVSATSTQNGPAGIVPYVRGLNFSLGTTSQHDSSDGWSSVLSPDLAFRFNSHFSVDASAPIYDYIKILANKGTKAKPVYVATTKHFAAGDTALNAHLQFDSPVLGYELSSTLGLPSGNTNYGLGAGQVTYSFNNHLEHSFDFITPDLELGIGDSSSLQGTRVRKSYVSVGTLAYFQAGASFDLPHHATFSANAYEELPVTAQTLYSTTGKGKKKVTTATTKSVGEDNGFQSSLDIPLQPHVTLSGFYNRSLRGHIDTAGFSLTFLLKAPPANVVR